MPQSSSLGAISLVTVGTLQLERRSICSSGLFRQLKVNTSAFVEDQRESKFMRSVEWVDSSDIHVARYEGSCYGKGKGQRTHIILSLDGVKGRGVAADGLAFAIHQKFDIVPAGACTIVGNSSCLRPSG